MVLSWLLVTLSLSLSLAQGTDETPLTSVEFEGNNPFSTPVSYEGDEIGSFILDVSESGRLDIYNFDVMGNVAGLLVLIGLEIKATPSSAVLNLGQLQFSYNSTLELFDSFGVDGETMLDSAEVMQVVSSTPMPDGTSSLRLCRIPLFFLPPENPDRLELELPSFGVYVIGVRTTSLSTFNTYPTCVVGSVSGDDDTVTYEAQAVSLDQSFFYTRDSLEISKVNAPEGSSVEVSSFVAFPDGVTSPKNHLPQFQIFQIELSPPSEDVTATLKAAFDPAALEEAGLSASSLRFVFWDDQAKEWTDLPSKPNVDLERQIVSQETTHFSTWTLQANPADGNGGSSSAGLFIGIACAVIIPSALAFVVWMRYQKRQTGETAAPQAQEMTEGGGGTPDSPSPTDFTS